MSLVTRFEGFTLTPAFVANGPSAPVAVAIDESRLTLWIGEPSTVWQTPISELHQLEATVGRWLTIRFTIAGVRYRLRARRRREYADLEELIRNSGGIIVRSRRVRAVSVISVAVVFLAASLASVITTISSAPGPSSADVASANIRGTDLPPGFSALAHSYVSVLIGPAGAVTTSSTLPAKPTGLDKKIFNVVAANFYSCMHVKAHNDRFFGGSGVIPQIQESGTTYRSSSFGGMEIGSYSQYYATTQMVRDDLKEYSSARFGHCFAQQSAQILLGYVNSSADAAAASVLSQNYTPITFAHGWRRGGTAVVSLPGVKTPFTLVSILVAEGHREVAIESLVSNFSDASRKVVIAALNAVLARIDPTTTSGSA